MITFSYNDPDINDMDCLIKKKNLPKNFCGVDLLRLVMLIASLSTNWIFSLDGWSTGLVIVSIVPDSSPANRKPIVINILTQ